MMRAKRQRDRKAIASFQQGRQERQEGPAGPVPQKELPQKEEEDMTETVEVRPAGAAGAGGQAARSQKSTGQAVVQSHLPILSVALEHDLSLQSAEGGLETKAGGQSQVHGQPELQSSTVSDNQGAASVVRQSRARAPLGGPLIPALGQHRLTHLSVQGQPENSKSPY